jgi:cob(I)alamin adenosyltransferase
MDLLTKLKTPSMSNSARIDAWGALDEKNQIVGAASLVADGRTIHQWITWDWMAIEIK